MPVADKNGTAMIIKMKLMRPSRFGVALAQQQYGRIQGRSMLPLKMAQAAALFSFGELQPCHTDGHKLMLRF